MSTHTLAPLNLHPGNGSSILSSWRRFWRALVRRCAGCGAEVFAVHLAAGQEIQFHDAASWTIACRGGTVWVTQEADARDIFLNRGQSFTLDRCGLALVRACRDATLSIRGPAGGGFVSGSRGSTNAGEAGPAGADDRPDQVWLRSLYPESGPWNDAPSYRRAGLL